jgi:hypothetical protein
MFRRTVVRVWYGKNTRPYLNKIKETRARDAVVECLSKLTMNKYLLLDKSFLLG